MSSYLKVLSCCAGFGISAPVHAEESFRATSGVCELANERSLFDTVIRWSGSSLDKLTFEFGDVLGQKLAAISYHAEDIGDGDYNLSVMGQISDHDVPFYTLITIADATSPKAKVERIDLAFMRADGDIPYLAFAQSIEQPNCILG